MRSPPRVSYYVNLDTGKERTCAVWGKRQLPILHTCQREREKKRTRWFKIPPRSSESRAVPPPPNTACANTRASAVLLCRDGGYRGRRGYVPCKSRVGHHLPILSLTVKQRGGLHNSNPTNPNPQTASVPPTVTEPLKWYCEGYCPVEQRAKSDKNTVKPQTTSASLARIPARHGANANARPPANLPTAPRPRSLPSRAGTGSLLGQGTAAVAPLLRLEGVEHATASAGRRTSGGGKNKSRGGGRKPDTHEQMVHGEREQCLESGHVNQGATGGASATRSIEILIRGASFNKAPRRQRNKSTAR